MRTFTRRPIVSTLAMKADDINLEAIEALRELNGGLDQNNLPLAAIAPNHLVAGDIQDSSYGDGETTSTYLATSSYHRTGLRAVTPTTPQATIDPGSDSDLQGGWQPLWPLMPGQNTAGTVLEFVAREGMLHGAVHVDLERRSTFAKVTDGVTTYPTIHDYDTWQAGVFVNDVLVADSGPLYPQRYTLDMPWSCPAPNGDCRVETRVKFSTRFQQTGVHGGTSYAFSDPGSYRYTPINIFGTQSWCRNQYR